MRTRPTRTTVENNYVVLSAQKARSAGRPDRTGSDTVYFVFRIVTDSTHDDARGSISLTFHNEIDIITVNQQQISSRLFSNAKLVCGMSNLRALKKGRHIRTAVIIHGVEINVRTNGFVRLLKLDYYSIRFPFELQSLKLYVR